MSNSNLWLYLSYVFIYFSVMVQNTTNSYWLFSKSTLSDNHSLFLAKVFQRKQVQLMDGMGLLDSFYGFIFKNRLKCISKSQEN